MGNAKRITIFEILSHDRDKREPKKEEKKEMVQSKFRKSIIKFPIDDAQIVTKIYSDRPDYGDCV